MGLIKLNMFEMESLHEGGIQDSSATLWQVMQKMQPGSRRQYNEIFADRIKMPVKPLNIPDPNHLLGLRWQLPVYHDSFRIAHGIFTVKFKLKTAGNADFPADYNGYRDQAIACWIKPGLATNM